MISWSELFLYTDSFLNFSDQKKIIQSVNQQVSLKSILSNYNINLIESGSNSDWKYKTHCPFFFLHKNNYDSSPSFGYNEKEDRFYCFGCKSSGKSVEFVSIIQGISEFEAAKSLLSSNLDVSVIENQNDQFQYYQEIKNILLKFANCIRPIQESFQDNHDYLQLIENLTWNIDLYLNSCLLLKRKINIATLEARTNKIIDYIKNTCQF